MAINLRRVLNGELNEFKLEYPCHAPDEQRWFRVEVRPQIAGRQSGAVIMHVNITDTKLAEETARKATWEIWDYKYALDESSIVAVTDAKGIIQHANDNFCRIAKYTKEELIGRDHRIVSSGYHSKDFIRNLWQTISSGRIWKGELKNKAKDGTIYWVDTTIVPFLDEKNKPYKYLAIRTDITERKRSAEEHLLNEERYRNLYENSIVAMVTYNLVTGKATEVNDMAVEVCGYDSKEDFLENFNPAIHYVNGPDRRKLLNTLMTEGEIKSEIFEVKKKNGSPFWVKVFLKLYADRTMAQAVIIDVTQQVRYHEELEDKVEARTLELTASLQREQAMNEMKSRFVSIASHEFRTPLSTILSSVSLVAAYPKEDQEAKRNKHIDRIKTSVKNLTGILNDFLSLEKLEQGKVEIIRQPVDIPQVAADLKDDLNGMLKAGQGINFDHAGDLEITLDKKILRHVLQNLLSNAIKYSGENSEITFTTAISDGFLTITVRDEGIGIPEEEQTHLFGEFFRAKNVAGIQGTGLGLNIVKRYVELLNGIINFESRPGAGTTFTVVFPEAVADTE
jgi:PAS domain S-box-containing protein